MHISFNAFRHEIGCTTLLKNLKRRNFGATMPAKSLGTLATIYATDKLQHPLPHYTMLSEADMNNLTGRSDAHAHSYASPLSNQHCLKGGGVYSRIAVA